MQIHLQQRLKHLKTILQEVLQVAIHTILILNGEGMPEPVITSSPYNLPAIYQPVTKFDEDVVQLISQVYITAIFPLYNSL